MQKSQPQKPTHLDDPARIAEIRRLLGRKKFLRAWYEEQYRKYQNTLERSPKDGAAIEIGSGGGFAKEMIPELITTDFLPYPGVDKTMDATKMSYEDQSLRAIFLMNVFHHIPDVSKFLKECERTLKPGGRVFMIEPYPGVIAKPIFKFAHHEPYDESVQEWKFESSGPVSDANGALPWIVFKRDVEKFKTLHPLLKIEKVQPHSPLRYWLSGGLKNWSLGLPGTFKLWTAVDNSLCALAPAFGSFVDIELVKGEK